MGYSGRLVAVSLVRLRNDSTVAEAVFNYFTACLMINLVNSSLRGAKTSSLTFP